MVLDHRFEHLEQLRSALSVITHPLRRLTELPVESSRWLSQEFSSHQALLTENEQLHQQNLKLQAMLQQYEALQAENMRLRNLLESSFKVGDRVLIAELAAMDLDPYRHLVSIKKGSSSGVFDGQPVLDAHGVMGQVTHAASFSSDVLLITDPSHALPVQVLRNGLRSIAVGSGRLQQLDLPYLPNNADIEVGDLLVTSGLGGKFPPGYPVARVTGVERIPGQPFAEINAAPLAHLDRSREVLLVWAIDPQQQLQEQKAETEEQDP